MKKFVTLFNRSDNNNSEDEIFELIKFTKSELDLIRKSFDYLDDPKLIEMTIYQEQAIISRFEYLISEAKKKDLIIKEEAIYLKACE